MMRGLLSIFPTPLHEVLVLPCPHSAATAQDVCLQTMRQCLTAHELDILIAGELSIDIDDWQQFTKYDNYTNESPQVVWFWELLRSWDQDRLSKLLLFVTGAVSCASGNIRNARSPVLAWGRSSICRP